MTRTQIDSMQDSDVVLLVGAGGSAPFGMPTMDRFNELIDSKWHDIAGKIIAGVPSGEPDLEYLLGRLTLYETILNEHQNDRNLRSWLAIQNHEPCRSAPELRRHIFDRIIKRYGKLDAHNEKKARKIYQELFDGFLSPRGLRPPVLPVFTTNYDLVFEHACSGEGAFRYCNGIYQEGLFQKWDAKTYEQGQYQIAIIRLHGCSHWMKDKASGEIFFQSMPDTQGEDFREPCVLYPLPTKEIRLDEEPFRTGYKFLRSCLANAKVLVSVGYSGRDPFIQAELRDSLGRDPSKQIVVVTKSDAMPAAFQSLRNMGVKVNHLAGGLEGNTGKVIRLARGEPPAKE